MTYQIQCPQGHVLEGDPAQARQVCTCPYCGTAFYMPDPPAMPATPPGYYAPPPGNYPTAPQGFTPPPGYGTPTTAYPPQPPSFPAPSGPGGPGAPMPSGYTPTFQPPTGPVVPPSSPPTAPAPGRDFRLPADMLPPGAAPSGPATSPPTPPTFQASGSSSAEAPKPAAPPAEEKLLHIPCPRGHILETPEDMLQTLVACPTCKEQFVLRNEDSLEFKEKKAKLDQMAEEKLGKTWLTWAIVAAVVVVLGLVGMIIASAMSKTPV